MSNGGRSSSPTVSSAPLRERLPAVPQRDTSLRRTLAGWGGAKDPVDADDPVRPQVGKRPVADQNHGNGNEPWPLVAQHVRRTSSRIAQV